MSKTGLKGVFLGVESCQSRTLKELNKFSTIDGKSVASAEEYKELFLISKELCKENDLKLKIGNINILADSTFEEFKESILFIKNTESTYNVEGLVRPLGLFENTLIKERYKRKGFLEEINITEDWQNKVRYAYKILDPKLRKFNELWQSYNVATFDFRLQLLRKTYLLDEKSHEMKYYRALRDIELLLVDDLIRAVDNDIDPKESIEIALNKTKDLNKICVCDVNYNE
jgi:radical SAM superfamily enzyme YgiQ (UPF0313 family)